MKVDFSGLSKGNERTEEKGKMFHQEDFHNG